MKKSHAILCLIAITGGVTSGCSVRHKYESTVASKREGVLSLWSPWLKDKKRGGFDARLFLRNDTDKTLLIPRRAFQCARGSNRGIIKNISGTIDLAGGETRDLLIFCYMDEKVQHGDFIITITQVFDNPNNDAATPGQVVAERIELKRSAVIEND